MNTRPPIQDDNSLKKLMKQVEESLDGEMCCEDTFSLLDEYVELADEREDASSLMPLVKHHLDSCSDCRDCFETLLEILKAESTE